MAEVCTPSMLSLLLLFFFFLVLLLLLLLSQIYHIQASTHELEKPLKALNNKKRKET